MKDETVIPEGFYCYSYENGVKKQCPYWSKDTSLPVMEDGVCSFLEINDWDENEKLAQKGVKDIEGEIVEMNVGIDKRTGKTLHFPMSLLWDEVKECDININDDDEDDED
jgi:hypothetical protein